MANTEHLDKFYDGIEAWNQWRKENPEIKPDLTLASLLGIHLSDADLSGADLSGADLSGADLYIVRLSDANLKGTNLYAAYLEDADLQNANLESGILKHSNLLNANLGNTNLKDAYLHSVNLKDAYVVGANLEGANLKGSNLEGANLEGANLEGANLEGTNLKYTNLEDANLKDAILEDAKFNRISFSNAILKGAKLSYVKLYGANLKGCKLCDFNFSDVDLSRVNLSDADLARIQALRTNFQGANLTGACIEDWNINIQTNLQNVKCDYIYLKKNFSKNQGKKVYAERRPHHGTFKDSEFTKLFQKALETVDLIFSEGIEWAAFLEAFQQLQAEIESEELSIQAIEKKSGGAFVVRVEVPAEADKAEIQKYIERKYEAKLKVIEAGYQKQLKAKDEELIKAYREKGTDLLEMARIMSSVQQNTVINNNPTMETGNTYNQSGNIGIGHNQGNISGNAKIAGVINEAAQQDLTTAATEIQQLLDQLSNTYPTKKYAEKMEVGAKLIEEIENNPTRWQKVINVIKAMGIEALAEAVDHPIFNIAKAGIEAAVESES